MTGDHQWFTPTHKRKPTQSRQCGSCGVWETDYSRSQPCSVVLAAEVAAPAGDLHSRLLERCDDEVDLVLSPQPFAAALRTVVELHRPGQGVNPFGEFFTFCVHCGYGDDGYPCETTKVIASNLGIEVDGS